MDHTGNSELGKGDTGSGSNDDAQRQAGYLGGSLEDAFKTWARSQRFDNPPVEQYGAILTDTARIANFLTTTTSTGDCHSVLGTPGCGALIAYITQVDPATIPDSVKSVLKIQVQFAK